MNRRRFLQRIAKASLAFSCAPGVFRAIPASKNVREAVAAPKLVPYWFQTTRRSRCIDAAYAEYLHQMSAPLVSMMPSPVTRASMSVLTPETLQAMFSGIPTPDPEFEARFKQALANGELTTPPRLYDVLMAPL